MKLRQAARRSRRDLRILLLIAMVTAAIAVGLGAGSSSARQETPEPDPAAEEATREALEEFAPTEQISADRAIAFPVDI